MPESHVLGQCCLIKFWNMKGDSSFFYFPYQQLVAFSSLSAFIVLLVNRLILVLNKRNLFNVCLVLCRFQRRVHEELERRQIPFIRDLTESALQRVMHKLVGAASCCCLQGTRLAEA